MRAKWLCLVALTAAAAGCGEGRAIFDIDVFSFLKSAKADTLPYLGPLPPGVPDTIPVQTPLNVAILYAVGEVLIPIDPCVAALAGVRALEDLVNTVSGFRQEFTDAGPLVITGVLITRTDRAAVFDARHAVRASLALRDDGVAAANAAVERKVGNARSRTSGMRPEGR